MSESTIAGMPIASKYYDLPAVIEVETRIISHQVQIEQNITHTLADISLATPSPFVNPMMPAPIRQLMPDSTALQPLASAATTSVTPTTLPPPLAIVGAAQSKGVEIAIQTESGNPVRDRAQQCEISGIQGTDVGIQCDMELDEFMEATNEVKDDNNDDSEMKFLKYAKDITHTSNSGGKYECLECGEVKKSIMKMLKHMILHYGPSSLCYKCGTLFSHKVLLNDHKCVNNASIRNKRKIYKVDVNLKCPCYSCPMIAISKHELYDHINEHAGINAYRCKGCHRSFKTYGELKYHMSMRMNCLESKKYPLPYGLPKDELLYRKRVSWLYTPNGKPIVVKSAISDGMTLKQYKQRTFTSPRYCHLCLQRCSNAYKLKNHIKRCTLFYRIRIDQKRNKENVNLL